MCLRRKKFHPDQPTSTLATAGLSERNVIIRPVVRTHLNNTEPTLGQFPKMKNDHKCTIYILLSVFNLQNKLLPWKKPSSKRNLCLDHLQDPQILSSLIQQDSITSL